MKIEIAARLKPFSHTPGAACALPGSKQILEAYPALLKTAGRELKLSLTGPVKNFTVEQDLEKNCVWIFGQAAEGFYRLRVWAQDDGVRISPEKAPAEGIAYEGNEKGVLRKKEILFLPCETEIRIPNALERLSLGSHRDQNWDRAAAECDLKLLIPALFFLGQKIPAVLPQPLKGTARLLAWPEERKNLANALERFFRASFAKIGVPRLADDQHQGIAPEESVQGDPFFLIQEGAKQLRSLFFRQNDRRIGFLPHLPPEFDAGRMLGVQALGIGSIDFEWTKGKMRRATLRGTTTGEVVLDLPKGIDSIRVRSQLNGKGKKLQSAEPLLIEAGKIYFLDHFQK